jgi:hypothetical protein
MHAIDGYSTLMCNKGDRVYLLQIFLLYFCYCTSKASLKLYRNRQARWFNIYQHLLSLQFKQLKQPVTEAEYSRISRITHKRLPYTSYTQYSGLIALSTPCLVLLVTDAYGSDNGLEYSTPQIHFQTSSTLCSSSAKSPSRSTLHSCRSAIRHTLIRRDVSVHLLLSAGLICCLLDF